MTASLRNRVRVLEIERDDLEHEIRRRARMQGARAVAGVANTTEPTVERWLRGGTTSLLADIADAVDKLELLDNATVG
jgi:hypothetical protein